MISGNVRRNNMYADAASLQEDLPNEEIKNLRHSTEFVVAYDGPLFAD